MARVPFTKMEGLGNDFIVVEGPSSALVTPADAVRLCDRRRGIGADGVLALLPALDPKARAEMRVYNADGSIAEMCGNGLRCVVVKLAPGGEPITISTGAGDRTGQVLPSGEVRVDLADATLIGDRIPALLGSSPYSGTGISMGNPHLVLDPFEAGTDLMALARAQGPALERHPGFADRVNVGFVSVEGPRKARLVVFERGAGITEACGTGAGAAAVALIRAGLLEAPVEVELPGGKLIVEIEGDPRRTGAAGTELGRVSIIGPARVVYVGELDLQRAQSSGERP